LLPGQVKCLPGLEAPGGKVFDASKTGCTYYWRCRQQHQRAVEAQRQPGDCVPQRATLSSRTEPWALGGAVRATAVHRPVANSHNNAGSVRDANTANHHSDSAAIASPRRCWWAGKPNSATTTVAPADAAPGTGAAAFDGDGPSRH
jgi:hypothetical protein